MDMDDTDTGSQPALDTDFPHLDETVEATAALIDTVSRLTDDDARAPSVLPGWTRGHVVTHLARNADALANVLHGAQVGEVRPQYHSQEERDTAIEQGAARPAAELLEDLVAACGRWEHAANEVHVNRLDGLGARLPDGPTFPVRKVGLFRRVEVEVHHADLDAGYTADRWPADFVARLMSRRRKELERDGVALRVSPGDAEAWAVGDGGPEVTGSSSDILWWLLGRGSGEGLACSEGRLPDIGRWT
jgi:maleylpyruvate isomerase